MEKLRVARGRLVALAPEFFSVTVGAGGSLVIGDGTNKVTLDNATLKGGTADGAGTLTLANSGVLTLATGGTIVVAGTAGKVSLPNTEFGAGTYTAAGTVTINAKTAGDEIVTSGAGNATDGLTIGTAQTITLTQGTSGTAATFTLTKNGGTGLVTLGETSSMGTIKIPKAASSKAGELKADDDGFITIVAGNTSGGITLEYDAGGSGSIYLVQGAKLGKSTTTNEFVAASSTPPASLTSFTAAVANTNDWKITPTGTADTTIIGTSDFDVSS
jgi:hypothetical protein